MDDLEKEIKKKEQEIKDLMKFADLVNDLDKQIDLRLDDLSKLYKKRSK
jgi:hypothetical protein|nr:MAG TPA: hypothetical protein [Caudoviricetes sp.]